MKQLNEFVSASCKKTFIGLLLFVSLCFVACSNEEPSFPDPGIDMTQQQDVVVHCDTATTYTLSMKISTPGGLKILEIINPKDDSLIEDLSAKYAGQKDFVFEYPIELPDKDTLMHYNVRIVDEQLRVINKPLALTVKAKSKPVIELIGFTENMVIENPNFIMKAKFQTGMNTIKEYKFLFGDQLLDSGKPVDNVSTFDYEFLCKLQMDWHVEYKLNLILIDSKNQTDTTTIKIMLKNITRPKRVVVESYMTDQETEHKFNNINLTYDQNDLLTKIQVTNELAGEVISTESFTLGYNEQKMVSTLKVEVNKSNWVNLPVTYLFDYETNGKKLIGARRETNDGIDPASNLTVTSWDDNGYITSFLRGATAKMDNISYTTNGEETVLSEYLWTTSVLPVTRRHFEEITPIIWPTYCPELLPFFAEIVPNKNILNLFCYKYIFTKRVFTNSNGIYFTSGDTAATYTYTLDDKQRVKTVLIAERKLGYVDKFDNILYSFEY